jgi:hypothetical protein
MHPIHQEFPFVLEDEETIGKPSIFGIFFVSCMGRFAMIPLLLFSLHVLTLCSYFAMVYMFCLISILCSLHYHFIDTKTRPDFSRSSTSQDYL